MNKYISSVRWLVQKEKCFVVTLKLMLSITKIQSEYYTLNKYLTACIEAFINSCFLYLRIFYELLSVNRKEQISERKKNRKMEYDVV